MFEPGYYKTNYRALRLRETIRWFGWRRGVPFWITTRFMRARRGGTWMPRLWAENECSVEDLSPDFWQATKPHRADFEKLGFVQCHLTKAIKKSDKLFDPSIRDSGGIFYLDSTRCYFGQLIYIRVYNFSRRQELNNIRIAFTAVLGNRTLTCTNRSPTFDSANTGKVVTIASYDVPVIFNRFREELERCSGKPRSFPDTESLRQWSDSLKMKSFEDRVRRGLFVRMTESEIAAAKADLERGRTLPPPLPGGKFRLELLPTTMVFVLLIVLILYRHPHGLGTIGGHAVAAIDYQGQQFKLSRSYTDFDDYKDDSNNLDTNELPRIEQTMESVKLPASFKNFKELVYATVDLKFPGYGQSVGGGTTDDGSKLDVVSTEIPQADKERVVVARSEPDGSWKLVDDFIYCGSDTNDINRVRLEHRQLEYFDHGGRLVRKKSL